MQIHLSRLTPEARERIAGHTVAPNASKDHVVLPQESMGWKWFAVLLGGGGIAAALVAAPTGVLRDMMGRSWGFVEIGIFAFAVWILWLLAVYNFARARRMGASKVKPAIIFSPLLVARTGLDDEPIHLDYLKDLKDWKITHHHTNGAYTHTAFAVQSATGEISFQLSPKAKAEEFVAFLDGQMAVFQRWGAEGSLEKRFAEEDWIKAVRPEDPTEPAPVAAGGSKMSLCLLLAALTVGVCYGANVVHVEMRDWSWAQQRNTSEGYRDYIERAPLGWHKEDAARLADERGFAEAAAAARASVYRDYLKHFPQGKRVADAHAAIRALYVKAEADYLAKAKTALPQAAEGMRALLAHLAQKGNPEVRIAFAPAQGIDGAAIEKDITEKTGSSRVQSVGPSFSADRNRQREERITAVMRAFFRRVFAEDLFDLQGGSMADEGARFLVRVKVQGSGSFYTEAKEDHLPLEKREIYPGIQIEFDFALQVPGSQHPPSQDPTDGYAMTILAKPAPNIDIRGDVGTGAVYDRMVQTAFEEFEVRLANAYGLELTMPESWGKLPGSSGRSSPYGFTPPNIDIPRVDIPRSDPLANIWVDLTISQVVLGNRMKRPAPTIDELMAEVKAKAASAKRTLPPEAEVRAKLERKWRESGPRPPAPRPSTGASAKPSAGASASASAPEATPTHEADSGE